MKKLMEDWTKRAKSQDSNNMDSYQIIAWQNNVEILFHATCEAMIQEI